MKQARDFDNRDMVEIERELRAEVSVLRQENSRLSVENRDLRQQIRDLGDKLINDAGEQVRQQR